MDIKKLQAAVIDALEDIKAQNIVLFDTTGLTSLFDRMVIASGSSNRQTKALAASVRDKVKQAGGTVIGMEGEDSGEWVLVDVGDMIVHIMQPAIRTYYRLEEIWGGKPIDLASAKRAARRPSATAAKKKTTDGKTGTKAESAESKTAAPKKTAARKSAATGKTSTARNKAAVDEGINTTEKPKAAKRNAARRKTAE